MSIKREFGAVQPAYPWARLMLRVPFIHYGSNGPDFAQGLLMCTVCLSIITVLTAKLGMSFRGRAGLVILNGACTWRM